MTVQGNAFAAAAIASVPAYKSPGGAPGAPFLRGILGLELPASAIQLNDLVANGVTPWFMSSALEGAILHNAVTTSLVSGKKKVFRRRMTDFLTRSIANLFELYVGQPLDIILADREFGPFTSAEIGAVKAFLQDLKERFQIVAYRVDPFNTNTQAAVGDGQWVVVIETQLVPAQEKIILKATIGETITVSEA